MHGDSGGAIRIRCRPAAPGAAPPMRCCGRPGATGRPSTMRD